MIAQFGMAMEMAAMLNDPRLELFSFGRDGCEWVGGHRELSEDFSKERDALARLTTQREEGRKE